MVVGDGLAMGNGVYDGRLLSLDSQSLLHEIPILTILCRACSREISQVGPWDCGMRALDMTLLGQMLRQLGAQVSKHLPANGSVFTIICDIAQV